MEQTMILAQYSIRSKQEYIFKTNRVLEIIGASECIATIWDKFFEIAHTSGLQYQRTSEKFQMEAVQQMFYQPKIDQPKLHMVELFCGGGNETILYDSMESYTKMNRIFSYELLNNYPGMIPMAVCVEVSGDYSLDYESLMNASERKKNTMIPELNVFTVPFAMMDRSTFQPYSRQVLVAGKAVRMSDESAVKYEVGKKLRDKNEDISLFDEMITCKGKESLLAVVHADGNNMGSKIMGMLHGEKDYDRAVDVMREFTQTTSDCFEKQGDLALKNCQETLEKKYKDLLQKGKLKKSSLAFRRIIGSGDDVTFVCNARYVMDYVKAYLDAVQNYKKEKNSQWSYSSCAGVCIFHSHYPFSKAYAIAEQACDDGAKKKVHIVDETGQPVPVEQGWMDFHFIHSGIGGDLEEIRSSQGTDACIARPWLISFDSVSNNSVDENAFTYEKLMELHAVFLDKKVSRTNIKTIGSAFERSETAAKKELIHLYGHTEGLQAELEKIFPSEELLLKAIYDYAEIYDLWYGEVK